jgi:hypothetical protein
VLVFSLAAVIAWAQRTLSVVVAPRRHASSALCCHVLFYDRGSDDGLIPIFQSGRASGHSRLPVPLARSLARSDTRLYPCVIIYICVYIVMTFLVFFVESGELLLYFCRETALYMVRRPRLVSNGDDR